jgi:hypothetical protein
MSKSKWKELPDWQNAEDYAFLDTAPTTIRAWEALRRHEAYRKDWDEFQALLAGNNGKQPVYYNPPKPPKWDEQRWLKHVVSQNLEPKITTESQKRAEVWGLREMLNPSEPYYPAIGFQLFGGGFPKILHSMEDLEPLVDIIEHGNGIETQCIVAERAVAAVNMTQPLKGQFEMLLRELEYQQLQLVNAGKIVVQKPLRGFKGALFIRHLRVLDARRTEPRPSLAEIAMITNPKTNAGKDTTALNKVGTRYVSKANKVAANYRNILIL